MHRPAPGIQLYRQRTTSRSGSSGDTWWTCSRYSTVVQTENNNPERLIWGYLVDLLQVYSCTDREQQPGAAHLGIPCGPAPDTVQLYRQRTTSLSSSSGDTGTLWTCSRYSTVVHTENNNPEQLIWRYLVDLLKEYSCTEREQQPGAAHLGIPDGPAPGTVQLYRQRTTRSGSSGDTWWTCSRYSSAVMYT